MYDDMTCKEPTTLKTSQDDAAGEEQKKNLR